MLERFKKQKLIQESSQVKGQSFPVVPASNLSQKAVQQKQKNVGTRSKKSVTYRTEKVGLSKSQSKLICVELPHSPQKERMKIHCKMIGNSDHPGTNHGVKKYHQLLVHNDPDSSDYHTRRGHLEGDCISGDQCTTTTNHPKNQIYNKKKNCAHQASSQQPVNQKIDFFKVARMGEKAVLTDQNRNLIPSSIAKNSGEVLSQPGLPSYECSRHSSSCEADDENSYESDKSIQHVDSPNHIGGSMGQKVPAGLESQHCVENVRHHDKISELSDCTQIANTHNCRKQETYRSKATDKHGVPPLNVSIVKKNSDFQNDGRCEETNEITHRIQKNKTASGVSPEKNETNLSRNQECNKVKKKVRNTKICQDSLGLRSGLSEKQADIDNGKFSKTDSEVTAMARNGKSSRSKETGELNQQVLVHSDESYSLHEGHGYAYSDQVITQKFPLKTGTSFPSKSLATDLSKSSMRETQKEKDTTDGLKVQNVMHSRLKGTHSARGRTSVYYVLEQSVPNEVFAINEAGKKQRSRKITTVSNMEGTSRRTSAQKFGELSTFAENRNCSSYEPISKAKEHSHPCDLERNTVSTVAVRPRSLSKCKKKHSSHVQDNPSRHPEQVAIHRKSFKSDSANSDDNRILQCTTYVSSEDMCSDNESDPARKDCSHNKSLSGRDYVVSKTPVESLRKQSNPTYIYEKSDSQTSDHSTSDVDEEPSHCAHRNQNNHASSQKNNNNESLTKSLTHVNLRPRKLKDFCQTPPEVVDGTSNHEACSVEKGLSHKASREQNSRVASSGFVNKCALSEKPVSNLGQRSKGPRKSLFNSMKSQLSDFVPDDFVSSFSNRNIPLTDKKRSKRETSNQSSDEDIKNECQNKSDNMARSSKRHKSELCGRQGEPACETEAAVPSKSLVIASHRKIDTYSECSVRSIDVVKGTGSNSTVADNASDSNLNETFTLPCREEHEDHQNSDGNLIRHHELHPNVHNNSSHVEYLGRNKVSSLSSCGIACSQKCGVLEIGLTNSSSHRHIKEHDHKHHREKMGNPKNDCDSGSLPYNVNHNCDVVDLNHSSSYIANLDDGQPQKKRDLSKNILLRCSSVESDFHNYVTLPLPVTEKLLPRPSVTDNLNCHCKMRSDKCKSFKHDSVVGSSVLVNNNIYASAVDSFCSSGNLHSGMSSECAGENSVCHQHEHLHQNLSIHSHREADTRGTDQDENRGRKKTVERQKHETSVDHDENGNAIYAFKFKSNKKKSNDESHLLARENISETDKNVPYPTRCSSSSTARERHVPEEDMSPKSGGSVAVTHQNTTHSGSSFKGCNNHHKQKTEISQSVTSGSCLNSADVECNDSDASVLSSGLSDDERTSNQKKHNLVHSSGHNPQGSSLHENMVLTTSCGQVHCDGKNEHLLGVNREIRSDPDPELNRSSKQQNHKHTKNESDVPQRSSKQVPIDTGGENNSILLKSPANVMKLKKGEHARTSNLKRKKSVFRMHTRYNEDAALHGKTSNMKDVVLQFERYDVIQSESSGPDEPTKMTSSPSFESSPRHRQKRRCSKKHSFDRDINRNEKIDIYLLKQKQMRPKWPEQQSVTKNLQSDDSKRCGKSDRDLSYTITELKKDENDDFRISSKDMENYNFSDEDSDTVYTNY